MAEWTFWGLNFDFCFIGIASTLLIFLQIHRESKLQKAKILVYLYRTAMTDKLVFETESESLVLPSSVDLESGIGSIRYQFETPFLIPWFSVKMNFFNSKYLSSYSLINISS